MILRGGVATNSESSISATGGSAASVVSESQKVRKSESQKFKKSEIQKLSGVTYISDAIFIQFNSISLRKIS